MNIFSTDSFLFRFLNLIADIVLLHILWIICSLPIITIGASTTALYYTAMKRVRKDEGYIVKNFLLSFKQNLKQSTIIWLIVLATGIILYIDFRIAMAAEGMLGKIMLIGCSTLIFPYTFTLLYIFPIQAKFENNVIANLKNAFLMSFSNLGCTFALLVLIATFVILAFSYAPFIGVLVICGMGTFGYLSAGIFVYIFRKYIPNELEEDIESNGMNFDDID